MPERVFGHIPGYPEGSRFESRADLSEAGLHRPTVAGISGSEREGADSIVLSGGYEDDQDFGDEIVYTGHGGRGPDTSDNILCLCPNHHVLFDHGGVMVSEYLSLIGMQAQLKIHPQHQISKAHLQYRRKHYQGTD